MCKQPAEKFEPVLSDGADQAAGVTEAAVDGNAPAGTVSGEGVDQRHMGNVHRHIKYHRFLRMFADHRLQGHVRMFLKRRRIQLCAQHQNIGCCLTERIRRQG